jgi:O-antigen ligase
LFFSAAATGGEPPLPAFVIRLTIFSLSLAALWRIRRFPAPWGPVDLPAILFLLYALVSAGWAVYPWAAYQHAMNVLCVGLVYLALRRPPLAGEGEPDADRAMAVVLAAAALQAAYAVFQHLARQAVRPAGSFANPNFLAGFLFFGAVAAVHFGIRKATGKRPAGTFLHFTLAALLIFGIYLARSRAMLMVGAGVSLFLLLAVRERKGPWLAGAFGGAALLVAAAASRFSTAVDPYALGRLYIWKAAWKTALAHPFGVGLGGFKFFWLRLRDPIETATFRYGRTADTAHSQFFGILADLGFPGILLASAVAVSVLVLAWRESRRRDRILSLCLIPLGAMIHAFFDVNLNVFAIAIPVAACAALLANRNAPAAGEGVRLTPVLRGTLSLVPLLFLLYSAATYLGQAHAGRGMERLKEGKTEPALRDFSLARRFDPFSSAYPDAVSSVHFRWHLQTRRPEYLAAAVNAEQGAHVASPEDSLHLSQLGFLLGELAETAPSAEIRRMYRGVALAALGESLRKDPYSIVAHIRTAELLRRSGSEGEARAVLERLIAIEPNAAQAYLHLARLEEAADPRKAAAHYRKAVALSQELSGRALESWEREILRVDGEEIGRRVDALERGQFPAHAGGQ